MAMLMVVVYHCFCAYSFCELDPKHWGLGVGFNQSYLHLSKYLHTIDMPAFTLISGYLYAFLRLKCGRYEDKFEFLKKKAKRLILPYGIWFSVILLLMPDRGTFSDIFRGIDHLWYLLMLFWCFVTIALSEKLWSKLPLIVNLIVCFFSFSLLYFFLYFNLLTDFLCIESFLAYFPYFFLGVVIVNHDVDIFVEKKVAKSVVAGALAFALVALFFLTDSTFRYHSDMLARLCGFFISVLLLFLFKNVSGVNKLARNNWVMSLNKNSMGIYLLHLILILFVLERGWITDFMNNYLFIAPFLLFVVVLCLTWLISALLNKTKLSFLFG